MSDKRWVVRLSAVAEMDYREILRWTVNAFGQAQAQVYAETLASALRALSAGTAVIGSKERVEIGQNIWTLHVARNGRKGRHFVMFRTNLSHGRNVIEVLRILHDGMDLQRHL